MYNPGDIRYFCRYVMANKPYLQEHIYVTGDITCPSCHLGQMDIERLNRGLNRACLYDQRQTLFTAHINLTMLICHLIYKVTKYWEKEQTIPLNSRKRNNPGYPTIFEKNDNNANVLIELNKLFITTMNFGTMWRQNFHIDEYAPEGQNYKLMGMISRNKTCVRDLIFKKILNQNLYGRELEKQREKGEIIGIYKSAVIIFAETTNAKQINKDLVQNIKEMLQNRFGMQKISYSKISCILNKMPRFKSKKHLFK